LEYFAFNVVWFCFVCVELICGKADFVKNRVSEKKGTKKNNLALHFDFKSRYEKKTNINDSNYLETAPTYFVTPSQCNNYD